MGRRLRLLMIIADLAGGGAERVFSQLLEALPRDRFDLHLCLWREQGEYALPAGIPLHVLEKHRPWHVFRTIDRTRKLIEELQPDVVFSTLHYSNMVVGEAILGSRWQGRWICRLGNAPERQMRGLLRWWGKRTLRRADCVIGNSRGVSRAATAHLKLDPEKVRTVYNFVDLEQIHFSARETLPFERPPGTFVVVHAGRFHRQKNQVLLLQSFARLSPRSELWMLGKGALEGKLRREARRLGISSRVRWLGFADNPFRYFKAADCYVQSSDYEGLPNSVIEAMACGCPVVSTRCPYGPDELIEDGVSGFLVPPGDLGALSAAMERLFSDPALRRRTARAAIRFVGETFARQRCLDSYESLLRE
jgi:glycosyltransferase involved in cell wall biosynthesis